MKLSKSKEILSTEAIFFSFCVSLFNLRSCHLRLTSMQSHLVCVSQHRWLNGIGQEKAHPLSLAITRDTEKGEELRAGQSSQYLNNIIHGNNLSSTSAQPQIKLEFDLSLLRSNSLKFQPLVSARSAAIGNLFSFDSSCMNQFPFPFSEIKLIDEFMNNGRCAANH
jgi:hypothetical protein